MTKEQVEILKKKIQLEILGMESIVIEIEKRHQS